GSETAYPEHVLDLLAYFSIENLPFELQRNFNLMRDLDQRTEGKISCSGPFL
uniref:Inhibitor of growth protein N-terminal histone-binding domain-containing protein n=1 Tax=Fundulus heteroclitus TaxID=8078 RepID=A0A3Q2PK74_FUNHE